MSFRATVLTSFSVVGFHRWPNAPARVHHLRDEHRHVFVYRVEVDVKHDDRDVEFQMLQADCRQWVVDTYPGYGEDKTDGLRFDTRSCERLAAELFLHLVEKGVCVSAVEVWEDNESGARVVPEEAS